MIKRHSILTAILLCFVAFTQVMAQEMQEPEPLPIDPKVRYGKLSNGLTYYIRHNDQPKDRADFYIAQNVGSILEEDNQRGLAHFLEHMAFDGSRNFPNNGMDEYIESVGMRSGENFNAYVGDNVVAVNTTDAQRAAQKVLRTDAIPASVASGAVLQAAAQLIHVGASRSALAILPGRQIVNTL